MEPVSIGEMIREKRKEKGLTQAKLAELLNVTDKAVSHWENGYNLPDLTLFHRIDELLETNITEQLGISLVETAVTTKEKWQTALPVVRVIITQFIFFIIGSLQLVMVNGNYSTYNLQVTLQNASTYLYIALNIAFILTAGERTALKIITGYQLINLVLTAFSLTLKPYQFTSVLKYPLYPLRQLLTVTRISGSGVYVKTGNILVIIVYSLFIILAAFLLKKRSEKA